MPPCAFSFPFEPFTEPQKHIKPQTPVLLSISLSPPSVTSIEHLEPTVLEAMPAVVFGFLRPRLAVFTTPNAEFNVLFPDFSGMRHWDHKFEWTRAEFQQW